MLDDSFKLKFRTVQLMCTEENEDVKIHNHEEFEILLFTKGAPEVMVQNQIYRAEENDMIFISPLEVHYIKSSAPYSLKCICFNPCLVTNEKIRKVLLGSCHRVLHFLKDGTDASYVTELFYKIVEAYERSDEWAEAEISASLTLMFSYLCRTGHIVERKSDTKTSAFCVNTLKYIAEHYSENITSFDVAKAISYSHGYFCRKFRSEFEQSFSEYLSMYRVAISRIFLKEKGDSVTEAAYKCGFNSADYYTVCFKRFIGVTPTEYKKTK